MRNWVIFGLVAVASVGVAGLSYADVPSALTSSVICRCVADGLGGASTQAAANKCTIADEGTGPAEDLRVEITVRNVLGADLAGSTVSCTATAMGGVTLIWDDGVNPPQAVENPQTAVSDGLGHATFVFDEGGVLNAAVPVLPNLDMAVTATGPGPGGAVSLIPCPVKFSVVGFDGNADGSTNLTDFAIFATDYGAGNARSDYNWDGPVNLTDFAQFAAHYLKSFTGQ
jgi:hypothetical protein